MAGLAPAIHVLFSGAVKTWMPATSAGMTIKSGPDLRPISASETSMPIVQSIELAREERIGGDGVAPKALKEAIARTAGAVDWRRARHADGKRPPLGLPGGRAGRHRIANAAARVAPRPAR